MKILIIMEGFFPGKNYGGPPVSVDNFCTLMQEYECYIVTRDHDLGTKMTYSGIRKGWNYRDNCKVLYLSDKDYHYRSFEEVIKKIKPNVIYLQSLFQSCVFPCLKLAKKYDIKVLLAPRGELNKGAFRKKYKKIPYIILLRALNLINDVHFQSTSIEETIAIKKYVKTRDENIHLLNNIPSIPKKHYKRNKKVFGEAKFIFLSRIHPKKNLLFALKLFRNIDGDVRFDIYGPIEDVHYWEKCKKTINSLPDNIKVKYMGDVAHEEVHEIFSKYDCFIFPTMSENYGHVIAESLSVGTPVIISDQTPWNDINDYKSGWALSLSNTEQFIKAINTVILMNNKQNLIINNNINRYINKKNKINQIYNKYYSTIKYIMED